jgi:hypothetical protein
MCTECGRQTSVTAGTIFHRIRTPRSTWFAAIWFVTSQKNGMSAQGLKRVLGFGSYETAWAWLHKLRRAMVRPEREMLSGVVELDEVFVGNESRGRAGGVKDHTAAMIAVESIPGRKLGRVRIELAEPPRSVSMLSFADRVIAKGSTVKTDGANYLQKLSAAGFQHVAFVGTDSPEPAHVNLPGVHMVASLLKRGSPAPCTTRYPRSTWPTTSTNTPSGSTGVPPKSRTFVLPIAAAGREYRPTSTRRTTEPCCCR